VDQFKGFVTANSYPNGRRPAGNHKALFFFNAKRSAVERHATAEVTGRGVTLLDAFNAAQAATGGTRINGTTMRTWLREFFPLHAIRPHTTDYCATCAELQTATRSARKSLERYKAGGSTEADALQQADAQLAELQERMVAHQASYRAEREAYVQAQHTSAQQLRAVKIAPSEEARRAAQVARRRVMPTAPRRGNKFFKQCRVALKEAYASPIGSSATGLDALTATTPFHVVARRATLDGRAPSSRYSRRDGAMACRAAIWALLSASPVPVNILHPYGRCYPLLQCR